MTVNEQTLAVIRDTQALTQRIQDQHTRDLVMAWAAAWDDLAPQFAEALEAVMADAEGRVTYAQMARATRLAKALEAAHDTLGVLTQENARLALDPLPEAVQAVVEANAAAIGTQLPASHSGVVVGWERMSPDSLAAIVTRTTQQIEAAHMPLPDDVVKTMRRELVRGVAVGDNPRATASRMVRKAEGRFNGGLSRALTIARTETIGAHNAAADMSRQANADVLKGWAWLAALDSRCCVACAVMHGQEFPVNTPGPEGHPNCRCSSVPVTKSWAELGIPGMDEFEDKPALPDAEQWFNNLTPGSQRDIMGAERLALYQSGAVSWSDLAMRKENPGWRASYVPVPVRQLG